MACKLHQCVFKSVDLFMRYSQFSENIICKLANILMKITPIVVWYVDYINAYAYQI